MLAPVIDLAVERDVDRHGWRQLPIVVKRVGRPVAANGSHRSMTIGCRVGSNAKRSETGTPQSGLP